MMSPMPALSAATTPDTTESVPSSMNLAEAAKSAAQWRRTRTRSSRVRAAQKARGWSAKRQSVRLRKLNGGLPLYWDLSVLATAAVDSAPRAVLPVKMQPEKALEKPGSTDAACMLAEKLLAVTLATLRSATPVKFATRAKDTADHALSVSCVTETAVAATPPPSSTTGAKAVPATRMEPRTSICADAEAKSTVTPAPIVSEAPG
jgi:hypothetical protein